MHKEHTTKASLLASRCPELHKSPGLDHLDLAIELTKVIGLALRAEDYHTEALIRSTASVLDTTAELLTHSYKVLFDEDWARRNVAGGDDVHYIP